MKSIQIWQSLKDCSQNSLPLEITRKPCSNSFHNGCQFWQQSLKKTIKNSLKDLTKVSAFFKYIFKLKFQNF